MGDSLAINTTCCKLGCTHSVIDNGAELLVEEPRSNSGLVRYIHLRASTLRKVMNSAIILTAIG